MNVIEVKGLSKKYRIGKAEKRADTILGAITNGLKSPLQNLRQIRNLSKLDRDEDSVFWALRDVSFEVKQGEVLGIIGHNGAGKSTLLKILSRITEPSAGEVRITGRVAALLEVGTGFHPELTGRENIYMNGTILGMRKKEIDKKLDEIVDFSGVEKYLDTPVKFYSSGMRVRLGFSVAAHLEPEILIIDEVLAVGDAEFQAKCLGKMQDVAGHGRTVLFVSHNMTAVSSLCSSCILLDKGLLVNRGETNSIIDNYLSKDRQSNKLNRLSNSGGGMISFISATVGYDPNSEGQNKTICGKDTYITLVQRKNSGHILNEAIAIIVSDTLGNKIFTLHSRFKRNEIKDVGGVMKIVCCIPKIQLLPGEYYLTLRAIVNGSKSSNGEVADHIENAISFRVYEGDYYGTGELPISKKHGQIAVEHTWSFEEIYEK